MGPTSTTFDLIECLSPIEKKLVRRALAHAPVSRVLFDVVCRYNEFDYWALKEQFDHQFASEASQPDFKYHYHLLRRRVLDTIIKRSESSREGISLAFRKSAFLMDRGLADVALRFLKKTIAQAQQLEFFGLALEGIGLLRLIPTLIRSPSRHSIDFNRLLVQEMDLLEKQRIHVLLSGYLALVQSPAALADNAEALHDLDTQIQQQPERFYEVSVRTHILFLRIIIHQIRKEQGIQAAEARIGEVIELLLVHSHLQADKVLLDVLVRMTHTRAALELAKGDRTNLLRPDIDWLRDKAPKIPVCWGYWYHLRLHHVMQAKDPEQVLDLVQSLQKMWETLRTTSTRGMWGSIQHALVIALVDIQEPEKALKYARMICSLDPEYKREILVFGRIMVVFLEIALGVEHVDPLLRSTSRWLKKYQMENEYTNALLVWARKLLQSRPEKRKTISIAHVAQLPSKDGSGKYVHHFDWEAYLRLL